MAERVLDMSVEELKTRAANGSDSVFAEALVARIEAQQRTIRGLFADVMSAVISPEGVVACPADPDHE